MVKEFYGNEQVYLTGGIVPSVYSISIDCEKRIVHILDLDRIGTRPVFVSFSEDFAEQIFEQLNYPFVGIYSDYEFIIYSTEGVITKWNNNVLVPLTHLDQCKQEFVNIMKERRKVWPKYKALYKKTD